MDKKMMYNTPEFEVVELKMDCHILETSTEEVNRKDGAW